MRPLKYRDFWLLAAVKSRSYSACMEQHEIAPQWENLPPELRQMHSLYPHLNYEELLEAWQNMERYIRIAIRIHRRLGGDLLDDDGL
jgi:hypothetical protein